MLWCLACMMSRHQRETSASIVQPLSRCYSWGGQKSVAYVDCGNIRHDVCQRASTVEPLTRRPEWDLLTEEFLCSGEFSTSGHDLDILRPFGMSISTSLKFLTKSDG